MRGSLVRGRSTDLGTPGILSLESGWECYTLELPWRNNERGHSCIVADEYHMTVKVSPRLQREVYYFTDSAKHGRFDVEIHNGNFAGDERKHFKSQVHGCILVGDSFGDVSFGNLSQWGIRNSRATLDELIKHAGNSLTLDIAWAHGCAPDLFA